MHLYLQGPASGRLHVGAGGRGARRRSQRRRHQERLAQDTLRAVLARWHLLARAAAQVGAGARPILRRRRLLSRCTSEFSQTAP